MDVLTLLQAMKVQECELIPIIKLRTKKDIPLLENDKKSFDLSFRRFPVRRIYRTAKISRIPSIRDKELLMMQIVDKLTMFNLAVSDMPKAKAFYADTLGLKVTKDYRQDDQNWWVTLTSPEGGVSITLSRYGEYLKPSAVGLYFKTSDLASAHQELSKNGAKVSDIQDDLFGPGSGVKFFQLTDPDGTQVTLY